MSSGHPLSIPALPSVPPSARSSFGALTGYTPLAVLGRGGMAEVLLAACETGGSARAPVVIKRLYTHLSEDPQVAQMFLDEARLVSKLDHEHIVRTFEAGVIDGCCCIVMEYLEGQALDRVVQQASERGGLPVPLALYVACSTLKALAYAHELRDENGEPLHIVHRDVSPHNVFLTNDGHVKVLDFGIAKAATQEGRTATGLIKGKLGYIAPEQALAEEVDARADVWSVGVVLWEALTGERLFRADTDAARLHLTLTREIPAASSLRAELPPELDALLARALARDPAERYGSASAMLEELERWLSANPQLRADGAALSAFMHELFASEIDAQQRSVASFLEALDGELSPSGIASAGVIVPGEDDSAEITLSEGEEFAELSFSEEEEFAELSFSEEEELAELSVAHPYESSQLFACAENDGSELQPGSTGAVVVSAVGRTQEVASARQLSDSAVAPAPPRSRWVQACFGLICVAVGCVAGAFYSGRAHVAPFSLTSSDGPRVANAHGSGEEERSIDALSADPRPAELTREPPAPLSTAEGAPHIAPAVAEPTVAPAAPRATGNGGEATPQEPAADTTRDAPSTTREAPAHSSFGYLSIDTTPWSIVSVGGKTLGQTPLVKVKLATGSHSVVLKNPDLHIETTYTVNIESGKVTARRVAIGE
jgi:serine/threonine-protein kinase